LNKLLGRILDAHGGLRRWDELEMVVATIVTGGSFWDQKGVPQDPAPRQMSVWLHAERASIYPFGAPDQRTSYTPHRLAVETLDGTVVREVTDPKSVFEGAQETQWDPMHRAFFNGYALWTYLTTPFVLAFDGVEVDEIEPWREEGATWRVLRARFPNSIDTHSEIQLFYFGDDLLLRRHDYNLGSAGGFDAAQLVFDYLMVDGIRLPTKRRAYKRGADMQPIQDPLMVSIDISKPRYT
jgi:hypothetical protein